MDIPMLRKLNDSITLFRADGLNKRGESDKALRLLDRISDSTSLKSRASLKKANILYGAGRLSDARKAYIVFLAEHLSKETSDLDRRYLQSYAEYYLYQVAMQLGETIDVLTSAEYLRHLSKDASFIARSEFPPPD